MIRTPSSTVSSIPFAHDAADLPARRPWLSVVVPVFNEEDSLDELYRRLDATLASVPERSEIVFVNDGSTDESRARLEGILKSDARITLVDLACNCGQHAAVLAGFRVSRGDVVVTLDADLQNPPEEIPKLLDKIRAGFDVVGGVRRGRKDPLVRRALAALVHGLSKSGTDYGCMLRAYRRPVVRRILRCRERTLFIPALAAVLAHRVIDVPIAHDTRRFGRSRYSASRLLRLGFDWLTGFSVLPVQLVTVFGVAMSAAGAAFGVFFLVRRLQSGSESDALFAVFALVFAVLGALFVAIGVVGEYVVRISIEVRHRPRYRIIAIRRGAQDGRS